MSVPASAGAFQLTHGSRTNVLGDFTCEPIARSTCCWRAARSRSSSAGAQLFLRTRAYPSARRPFRWISPFLKCRPFQKLSKGGEQMRDLVGRP